MPVICFNSSSETNSHVNGLQHEPYRLCRYISSLRSRLRHLVTLKVCSFVVSLQAHFLSALHDKCPSHCFLSECLAAVSSQVSPILSANQPQYSHQTNIVSTGDRVQTTYYTTIAYYRYDIRQAYYFLININMLSSKLVGYLKLPANFTMRRPIVVITFVVITNTYP